MKTNNSLLILGAGQYGMVAKEIADSSGSFGKIAFLDDENKIAIDSLGNYGLYAGEYKYAVVAIGNPDVRLDYIRKLDASGFYLAALISPRAHVSPSATVAGGAIIEPMAVINAGASVGAGAVVCAGAIVNHNATVGAGCLLQCGSIVAAGKSMSEKTVLGYNAVFSGE